MEKCPKTEKKYTKMKESDCDFQIPHPFPDKHTKFQLPRFKSIISTMIFRKKLEKCLCHGTGDFVKVASEDE